MVSAAERGDDVDANATDADSGGPAASPGEFHLALLRSFELQLDGRVLRPCLSEQRLVALLAVRGGLPRSAVAGLLWPEVNDQRAHGNLRTALWRLVKFCPGLVVVDGDHLVLGEVEIDVAAFTVWARRLVGGGPMIDGDVEAARATRVELLPGWYDDWVVAEREQLRQLRLHALEALARELAGRGRHAIAIEVALSAIALDPLRESSNRILISLYIAEDNLSEAARHLRIFADLLREELGVEPSPRMMRLVTSRVPTLQYL
jgi:DNA-binding SARP family transcriptional activator